MKKYLAAFMALAMAATALTGAAAVIPQAAMTAIKPTR